ncbi:chondrolectin-like [Thalassophryne amazonica]|uniref:chondrolectin-like n=1 Tax=Thalassophryne amazonica TaxID=390379 RepID=UPI001470BF25|nr:chondrolectin-like [Thalassophryne amazonica]
MFWFCGCVSGQTVCLDGLERSCYKIAYFHDVSSRIAFWEAFQACEMDGGSLLSIESLTEQKDIENLLQELRSGAVGGAVGGGIADGDFWIGLTRTEGIDQNHSELAFCPQLYHWTDGSLSSFRNWYFDEPSCGGEACVVMYHQPTALPGLGGSYLYQWNDDRCNMKHNFICKYEPESRLIKEQGHTPEGRITEVMADAGVVKEPGHGDEEVTAAGPSGMLLVYVIIPTIPLLLLILVASGTCCFQMVNRRCPFLSSESRLIKEQGHTPEGRITEVMADAGVVKEPGHGDEEVTAAGPSGMLLVYVIIPTIPLLLLILVASGTCCFQMVNRSTPRTKTSNNQSTLWISHTPRTDSMEV